MKKKFAIGGVFLLTYIGFLIATLPAPFVLNQFSLPRNIQLSGVNGSIWDTAIAQVTIDGNHVQQVNARLSFLSLLTLNPKLNITFGDEFIAGPEGAFALTLSQNKAKIDNLKLLLKANNIAQQLTLPLPMTARGDVELTLESAEVDLKKNNQCIAAKGKVTWSKAGVIALEQNVKLGKLTADIGCENGALAIIKNLCLVSKTIETKQNQPVLASLCLHNASAFHHHLSIDIDPYETITRCVSRLKGTPLALLC